MSSELIGDRNFPLLESIRSAVSGPLWELRSQSNNDYSFFSKKIQKMVVLDVYDRGDYVKDLEPLYGILLIACQIYLVSSVNDFEEYQKLINPKFKEVKKTEYFKRGKRHWTNGVHTGIELINSLANYYKHRNEPTSGRRGGKSDRLEKYTKACLDEFFLLETQPENLKYSVIYEGMEILGVTQDVVSPVTDLVKSWRDLLFDYKLP